MSESMCMWLCIFCVYECEKESESVRLFVKNYANSLHYSFWTCWYKSTISIYRCYYPI